MQTASSLKEGHKDKSAKAECRDEYLETYIDERVKSRNLKWKRDKTTEHDHSAPKKQHLSLKKEHDTPCETQSSVSSEYVNDTIGGLVSEVGLNELLNRPSCMPSYRCLPEKVMIV